MVPMVDPYGDKFMSRRSDHIPSDEELLVRFRTERFVQAVADACEEGVAIDDFDVGVSQDLTSATKLRGTPPLHWSRNFWRLDLEFIDADLHNEILSVKRSPISTE